MNKELFDALNEIRTSLDGQLDKDALRYLDRTITERKLDGILIELLSKFIRSTHAHIFFVVDFLTKVFIWTKRQEIK